MRRLLLLGFLLGAVVEPGSAQAGRQDFTLHNRTGYPIDEVFVTRARSRDWSEDVMGSGALDSGLAVKISITAPANICRWDMKVRYSDGGEAVWNDLDLCTIGEVALYWDKQREVTRAVVE